MRKPKWTLDNLDDLSGKIFVVTGANSGIGFEATKAFSMKNAKVIMGCRNLEKAEQAKQAILKCYKKADLEIILLDLMDFASINAFANEVINKYPKLDVLLNNAGIMTVPYGATVNGLEKQIGVNHFGHFYLTMKLLPLLNKTPNSRIVNIASIAHRFGSLKPATFIYDKNKKYHKSAAYAQSKLANLLFTYKLATLLKEQGSNITVVAAHPGITKTNLGRHITTFNLKAFAKMVTSFNQETAQGALPGIRACTDQSAISNNYYGPDGLFAMRGYPKLEKSNRKSHSLKLQNILWDYSVKITGLDLKL